MQQQYLDAIQAIADKLGTTTTKLWSVLLAQAPITASIELIFTIVIIAITVAATVLVYKKTSIPAATEDNRFQRPEWCEEGAVLAWCGVLFMVMVSISVLALNGESIVAGFLNPQYWALMKIVGGV